MIPTRTIGDSRSLKMSRLRKFYAALSKVRASNSDCIIMADGDSTTTGFGTDGTLIGLRSKSWPSVFKNQLAATTGLTVQTESVYGTSLGAGNSTIANCIKYDPRLAIGAGWTASGSTPGPGGQIWVNTTTTNAYSFTPSIQTDTIEITYPTFSGGGSFTLTDDLGNTLATIDQNGATALAKQSYTTVIGARTYRIARVSGTVVFNGLAAKNSTQKSIIIHNIGWAGSKSTEHAATGGRGYIEGIKAIAPHLGFVNLGLNDFVTGVETPIETYKASILAVVDAINLSGSAIIVNPTPANSSRGPENLVSGYRTALLEIEASRPECLFLDAYNPFTNYATSNALGLYHDTVHHSGPGAALLSDVMLKGLFL